MTAPVVSVVIPTYNRAALLPRAVESVIAQSFGDWEIVVVDDGSADDTPLSAERYSSRLGDRLVYLRQENRGASAARNVGIDAAHGEFVAFLDSDDEFDPRKLERQLDLFFRQPRLGLVYSDYALTDENGHSLGTAFTEKFPIARTVPAREVAPHAYECAGSLFDTLIRGYFVSTITGMVRKNVLQDRIRFSASHSYAEEWLFFLDVARAAQAGFIDEPLSIHHPTAGSLSRSDKRRNLLGMRSLLVEMRQRFADAPRRSQWAMRENLSRVCRQLAQEAHADQTWRALAYVFEAARAHPVPASFRASASILLQRLRKAAKLPSALSRNHSQVPLSGVR